MADAKSSRFTKYIPLLLDALRSADPKPMRPAEAVAWVRARVTVPAEDLTRIVQNGKQSIFENDVHWARFYLAQAGLLSREKRGQWSLTSEGREARLSAEKTWDLYVSIRDANRPRGVPAEEDAPAPDAEDDNEEEAGEPERPYIVADIVADGCFLTEQELAAILDRWRSKKNLILQGPPGTGKTWLAKRLGFALIGSDDRETVQTRLRVVQFHPSLAYEDFVRGWRPAGDGRLALVDGILMQVIEAVGSQPDRSFVLVIEEINRGNPAQIFGEMLTLLEASKRRPSEAIELAYRKPPGERVHMPPNLYVIGTMNVADRSLAIVDLALRRRFAFIDLEPSFGEAWQGWCAQNGLAHDLLAEIAKRINSLNAEIAAAITLGPQFRIGHAYVTPDSDELIIDGRAWFRAKVETEIGPLLDEYWYDAPETARAAKTRLLAGFD